VTCPDCGGPLPIQVCSSAAGYYIGRWCSQCGPYERLSIGYYRTRELAQAALDSGDWDDRDYAVENQEGGR
jgi:hypothetical protein